MRAASFFACVILASAARATVLETVPVNSHARAQALALAYYATVRKPAASTVRHVFRVTATGSMRPVLDSSHWVVVEALPFADLKAGHIAVFRHVRSATESANRGWRPDYLMHEVRGVHAGRAHASGIPGINNPYPPTESFGPDEFVGVVRKSWRVRQ